MTKKELNLKAICAFVTSVVGAAAGAISITANTTVTEANVADYVAVDIDIAAGATLTFSGLTTPRTFTGTLTGGGNFAVVSPSRTDVKMTLNGNATGFTGQFCFTNHAVNVSSPAAVGDVARINLVVPQLNSTGTDAYQCKFNPENATYRNFIDANVGPNNGVMPAAGVTFAGPIFWRGGRLYGNAIVTGPITNNAATMYCQGGMKLRGGVTSVKNGGNLQADGGNLYIESDVEKISFVQAIGHTIFFGKENALAESIYITFGVSYRHFGKVDLQGWNQRCSRFVATTDLANESSTYVTSADPATLSILNQSADVTWYGNLNGKASLSYASASGKRFTYNGRSGTSTGSITVNSGYFRFETNAVHKGLSKLVAKGTGTFEFPANTSGGNVAFASINPSGVSVAFEDTGKIDIASGAVLEVDTASVDDEYVEPGTYTKNDGTPVGEHITGGGTLRVLNSAPVTAGDTYVWTGAAGDGLLTTDGNWEGGAAPDLTEGTAKLFFSAGTASATVSGTAYVYGITFCTNAAFTLTGADANAKVVVGAGGFLVTNTAAASVTHVLDVPVEIGTLPQTWRVAATNTQLSLTAPLTGRAALAPLTIDCRGRVQFRADNSGLLTPLVLTNVTTATQPYLYDMKGLGAPSRFTTVWGGQPRFITDAPKGGSLTNETPLRLCSGLTNQEGAYINSSGNAHLYLAGPVSFVGTGLASGQSEIFFHGNVHFTGGITNETGGPVCFRMNSANEWIEGTGIHLSNTFAVDYGGALNISAPANDWTTLASYKATIVCHDANVLAKGKAVRMGGTGVYLANTSKLSLNGYDQSIGRFYMGWTPAEYPNNYTTVDSSTPAMLEIATDAANNDIVPLKVTGAAGLKFNAAGSLTFTNFTSATTGTLEVDRGTVRFAAGSGWTATTNVVLAGGTLAVAPGAGATAFGSAQDVSAALLTVVSTNSPTLSVAAGERATVDMLAVIEEGGKVKWKDPGIYGGPDAGLSASRTVDWISGTGTLRVRHGISGGTMLIIR